MQWFLARSRELGSVDGDWREWLLDHEPGAARLLLRHASGSCRRARASAAPSSEVTAFTGATTWACAEPVHLSPGIDHVRLEAPLSPPLDSGECLALLRTLNAALEDRGMLLSALDERRWLLASRDELVCEASEPPAAAGRDIRDLLPQGRDGQAVRRLMNELQMVLHEHAINERRATLGQRGANAVWLWGFGAVNPVEPCRLPPLAGDDEWLADLWWLHGGCVHETPAEALRRTTSPAGPRLIAWVDATNGAPLLESRMQRYERAVFSPLRLAIESGAIGSVRMLCGTQLYRFGRAERWSFWRRHRLSRKAPS